MNKKYEGHSPAPWAWGENDRGLFDASADEESMVLRHEPYEGMWLGHTSGHDANRLLIQDAPILARQNAELRACLVRVLECGEMWEGSAAAGLARTTLANCPE